MRPLLALAASACALVWSGSALPCGGAFGPGFTISPAQTIVVAHHDGVETYVFQPHFCGKAAEFGLILPVPAALSSNPELASSGLYDQLDVVSAPRHETRVEYYDGSEGSAGPEFGAGAASPRDGTNVVDQGKVGIFEWSLLKADNAASFTTWLDANGYPHPATADEQFSYYVNQGWYFVAFKVTASATAPTGTQQICGDFGPIQLGFGATTPVVPTRIAAVSADPGSSYQWRVYGLSSDQLGPDGPEYRATTKFSGALSPSILQANPDLAKLARPTDRLVKLELTFNPQNTTTDMSLVKVAAADYRETIVDIKYVQSPLSASSGPGGCTLAGKSSSGAGLIAIAALALVSRRRRRA